MVDQSAIKVLNELEAIAAELLRKWDAERERGVEMKQKDWQTLRAYLAEHCPQRPGVAS